MTEETTSTLDIGEVREWGISSFGPKLAAAKASSAPDEFPWYPYGTLHNLIWLDALLTGADRNLKELAPRGLVADIGAADGDLAFVLESLGFTADIIDHEHTNGNGLRGARLLKETLGSNVQIHDVDLDEKFEMPRQDYDLVFFLGILYHLKNPYYALEALRRCTKHCLVSTRIARFAGSTRTPLRDLPVAYLLGDREANNDPSNYWIFTETGLRRLIDRTGWIISDFMCVGDTDSSDPSSQQHDERAFCLLSRPPARQ